VSHALGQRRIGWLLLGFLVLLLVGVVRAFQLTTIDSSHLSSLATIEHTATISVPAARGEIVDRNGAILAVSEAADDITASPRTVRDPAAAAAKLAPLLNTSAGSIAAALAHPSSPDYTVLAHQVPAAISDQIRSLGIAGIYLVPDPRRVYPNGVLAGPVLGGVHSSGAGAGGLEAEYNGVLTGTPGVQRVVYDANGTPIGVSGTKHEPVAGANVQLTLDVALQKKVEQVLTQTADAFHPQLETAIVLDPRTNAILADANWPLRSSSDWAVQLNYEPGSTYKVVAIGGALADGLISPGTLFTIPDTYRVADRVIHDDSYHPTETMTVAQILARSSNIGAVKIGEKLLAESPTTNRFYDWTLRYGFGAPTGVDLPGEEQGIVPSPAQWSGSSIGNLPIGQGESVTPMQMAVAYSAIANGGVIRPPHIVGGIGGAPVATPHGRRIFSPTVAAELTRMLEDVFGTTGTASEIHIPGYRLAGKTGTANMVVNGTYSNRDYVASFVGFAPASHPSLEAIVVVQRPSNGFVYGTEVAAPAWKQIMDFALNYLKIKP
jgi:cell division protein FtsI/penicillin-binding protein 2